MNHPLFVCRESNKFILSICMKTNCEWFVHCDKFCNCTFVAAHYGPFSNAEIGVMMRLSGERIRKIEQKTLEKLKVMKEQGAIPHMEFKDDEDFYQEGVE